MSFVAAICLYLSITSAGILATPLAADDSQVSYSGFQLWTAFPASEQQRDFIANQEKNYELEIWDSRVKSSKIDFLISPDFQEEFKLRLADENITFAVTIQDLQTSINGENPPDNGDSDNRQGHPMDWTRYHRLEDIHAYLDYLAQSYPNKVELTTIGTSSEGRPLKVIRISSNLADRNRPALWVDGGIHAREWISPAVVSNLAYRLLEVPENSYLHNSADIYILPVFNVDGYEYSHTKNRMWRKTRSSGTTRCQGTDLNRNFAHRWGGKGQSRDPCSEIYSGRSAMSEPESQAVANFIRSRVKQIKVYLTVHSYGQYILIPWGYDREYPSDFNDMKDLALKAASKMRRFPHTVGNSAELLYPAAGGSDDWAKSIGIKYSYTVELPDTGVHGFVLPASYIPPVCDDFFPAFQVFTEQVATMTG